MPDDMTNSGCNNTRVNYLLQIHFPKVGDSSDSNSDANKLT